jgi:diadenylate cyclase
MRVVAEVNRYIIELGDEGRLIELQLTELTKNLDIEENLLIKDYLRSEEPVDEVINKIAELSRNELMDSNYLAKILGYDIQTTLENIEISPKGYRQLSKIPKTPINIIDNMHKLLGDFQHIIRASIEEFTN